MSDKQRNNHNIRSDMRCSKCGISVMDMTHDDPGCPTPAQHVSHKEKKFMQSVCGTAVVGDRMVYSWEEVNCNKCLELKDAPAPTPTPATLTLYTLTNRSELRRMLVTTLGVDEVKARLRDQGNIWMVTGATIMSVEYGCDVELWEK